LRQLPREERRLTDVGAYRIHSVRQGEGTPVVLLHGLSGSIRWWRYTSPPLAGRYRVHTIDLVGFGGSRPARPPGVRLMADILARWLEAEGIERPHIVGHSMGGQIAIHLLAGHRVDARSLTLVSASGIPHPRHFQEAARLFTGALRPRTWGAPTFVPSIAADALRAGPFTLVRAGVDLLADDVRPLLHALHLPTLVIWGALDPLLPLEDGQTLAAGISGARLVVIGDAAHNPMVDRPIEFNRVLLDHLDSAQ
jgi:pimeloyl-ACP methyl ester carboxylesterase